MDRSISIYWRLMSVQMRAQMQYRVAFAFDIFAAFVLLLFEFGSLALVFQRFGNLGGWRLGEIALLYGVVKAAFSAMDMIFSGFDPEFFGRHVRQGTFDQLLLRPVNITIQVLGSSFELRRLGTILQGLLILMVALSLGDIAWTWVKVVLLVVAFFSLVCFFGGLFIIGSTITFWTIESIEAINIFTYGGSEMIAYPMHIYPEWMRRFFTYIIPAIFLNYYPALYLLGKPDPFNMPPFAPWLAPMVGFGVLLVALRFWRFGIKHYQSTGT
jgi:ABC-2 type transport system permease protein